MEYIETKRLMIRRYCAEDWKDLYEYLSDERVVKYEPYHVFDEEKCKEEAVNRANLKFFWAVCLKDSGKLIGNIYFNLAGADEMETYEIGYVFNYNFWGKGYATEACKVFLEYAFEILDAHRVIAMCNPLNQGSWKLLERLHMRREAHLHKNIYFKKDSNDKPIWNDTFIYAILKEEYIEPEI